MPGANAAVLAIVEDEARPAAEQLDFLLHLGDFIYEVTWYAEDNEGGMNRGRRIRNLYKFPQGEKVGNFHLPVTLEDYRTLYRAYLEDPDLQDARARWPFVCVWDNHEFAWAGFQSQSWFPASIARPRPRKSSPTRLGGNSSRRASESLVIPRSIPTRRRRSWIRPSSASARTASKSSRTT